jgi:hypothetical protein
MIIVGKVNVMKTMGYCCVSYKFIQIHTQIIRTGSFVGGLGKPFRVS